MFDHLADRPTHVQPVHMDGPLDTTSQGGLASLEGLFTIASKVVSKARHVNDIATFMAGKVAAADAPDMQASDVKLAKLTLEDIREDLTGMTREDCSECGGLSIGLESLAEPTSMVSEVVQWLSWLGDKFRTRFDTRINVLLNEHARTYNALRERWGALPNQGPAVQDSLTLALAGFLTSASSDTEDQRHRRTDAVKFRTGKLSVSPTQLTGVIQTLLVMYHAFYLDMRKDAEHSIRPNLAEVYASIKAVWDGSKIHYDGWELVGDALSANLTRAVRFDNLEHASSLTLAVIDNLLTQAESIQS